MKYSEYFKMACDKFPELNLVYIPKYEFFHLSRIDVIKKVAMCLFIKGDVVSEFSLETKKQLINFREFGVFVFDKK